MPEGTQCQAHRGALVVAGDGVIVVGLGELSPVAIYNQRQMQVVGPGFSKGVIQQALPAHGVQQVAAPNHLCDVLVNVIDNNSQLVGNDSITAFDDEVSHLLGGHLGMLSLDAVFEGHFLAIGLKANG